MGGSDVVNKLIMLGKFKFQFPYVVLQTLNSKSPPTTPTALDDFKKGTLFDFDDFELKYGFHNKSFIFIFVPSTFSILEHFFDIIVNFIIQKLKSNTLPSKNIQTEQN